jgi:SAM-dependent methyltransferase
MDSTFWDQRYTEHPSPWTHEPNRFLVEVVDELAPGRALDLACGEGRNSLWLAANGWSVLGVDFSWVAVSRAGEVAEARGLDARFERHDLTSWVPPTAAFDLVSMVYLQIPGDEMATAVGNAAAAVAAGGTLFVVGHHLDNLTDGVGGPSMAEVLYTEYQLAAWCDDLDVVRAERALRPVDAGVAVDALLVAHRPGLLI